MVVNGVSFPDFKDQDVQDLVYSVLGICMGIINNESEKLNEMYKNSMEDKDGTK